VTVLLDANMLIALLVEDHVHHGAAENWFVGMSGNFSSEWRWRTLCSPIKDGRAVVKWILAPAGRSRGQAL